MVTQRNLLILVFTFLAANCSALEAQHSWPGFRNDGSGIISVERIPTKWSPEEGLAWRADVPGYGQSAPVVFGGKIFLTSSEGPWQEKCYVHAFDLASGGKLWTTEVAATTRVENYFRNSRAAPTCVVDENLVVSFFPSGDLTAMDHDGKKLWNVSLFTKFGDVNNERGTASSLAQTSDHVYVVVDHNGPSYLAALNKSDGSIAWKTDRGDRVESWASPVIANLGEKSGDRGSVRATSARNAAHTELRPPLKATLKGHLVIVSSADSVNAYDAGSGQEVWKVDDIQGNHIPSASVVGNSIFIGSTQMYGSDADPAKVAGSNCRIDFTSKDNKPSFEVKWGAERANSYYSSPLAFAGYVYYVNKSGILFCVNQETGERVFAHRIGNPCWASAIGVNKKGGEKFVFFVLKNGFTVVLRPGDEYDQVARNQLWDVEQMLAAEKSAAEQRKENAVPSEQTEPKTGPEKMLAAMPEKSLHRMFSYGDPTAYAASVVDGNLLIRTGQHLYCVRTK